MLLMICGNARSGKDTLFQIISKILLEQGIQCERFALADELKLIVSPFTQEHLGISAFTKDDKEKNLIRPILVSVANAFRETSKGTHWTGLLQPKVDLCIREGYLPVITDGRFCEYEYDEVWWAKSKNKGRIVFVDRYLNDGSFVQPANSTEAKNEKNLRKAADFSVKWPTSDNHDFLSDLIKIQLKDLIEEICLESKKKQRTN